SGFQWSAHSYIKASNTGAGDLFGSSVAATADHLVVGAPGESSDALGVGGDESNDLAPNSGAAYVFESFIITFAQQAYLKASDVNDDAGFGSQVAISGDRILVGSPGESQGNGSLSENYHTGAGYLFAWAGGAWTQGPYLKASNPDRLDEFGAAVGISEGRAVLGAWGEDGSSRGPFGDDTDNSASEAGAGYIFDLDNPFEYYCEPSVMNSTGFGGVILASGSVRVGDNRFYLGAAQIPVDSFGYFLCSLSRDYVPGAMGSEGTMCVGGANLVARKVFTIGQAPDYGFIASQIDLTQIPLPSGPVQVAPGETWHFQCWYRDRNPGPTSNFTSALSVSFE
ncbi:MAG: FG-GAP repeat protein, partial [Planctomycetota bacterium]|nr:FG-GAP repeat protein [Planctomycetota bacterium]